MYFFTAFSQGCFFIELFGQTPPLGAAETCRGYVCWPFLERLYENGKIIWNLACCQKKLNIFWAVRMERNNRVFDSQECEE